jgi:two-component system, NarL family, response regulator LiaR
MEKLIRIVLANHHPIIRSDLRLLLERQPAFRVTGEAANGREAVILAEYRRPDVVLLDIKLPQLSGIAAAREITSKKPALGIIFVTALADQEYVSEAFKAGARGYVLGDAAQADLVSAVHVVARGGTFLSPGISAKLIDEFATKDPRDSAVSEYEKQLCCLLAAGYNERDIATQLNSTSSRIWADYQTLSDTLQRISVPKVILDSIQGNHHLVENP